LRKSRQLLELFYVISEGFLRDFLRKSLGKLTEKYWISATFYATFLSPRRALKKTLTYFLRV